MPSGRREASEEGTAELAAADSGGIGAVCATDDFAGSASMAVITVGDALIAGRAWASGVVRARTMDAPEGAEAGVSRKSVIDVVNPAFLAGMAGKLEGTNAGESSREFAFEV